MLWCIVFWVPVAWCVLGGLTRGKEGQRQTETTYRENVSPSPLSSLCTPPTRQASTQLLVARVITDAFSMSVLQCLDIWWQLLCAGFLPISTAMQSLTGYRGVKVVNWDWYCDLRAAGSHESQPATECFGTVLGTRKLIGPHGLPEEKPWCREFLMAYMSNSGC